MSSNSKIGESPLQTGIKHLGIGLSAIVVTAAIAGGIVHLTGNPKAGSDTASIGLFQERNAPPPALKPTLADMPPAATQHEGHSPTAHSNVADNSHSEPSLPVNDPSQGATEAPVQSVSHAVDEPDYDEGVRITRLDPNNANNEHRTPLPQAPIDGLYEPGPIGRLPKISDSGTRPAEAYARPHATTDKPKIALIVGGLGIKRSLTRQAITDLPPEVTLSFVPYSSGLQSWVNQAREAGHEVLLEVPMEPYDYPNVDTGPDTLMTNLSSEENERRLKVILGQTTGYFGVINYQGAKLATDSRVLGPIMDVLNERGLALIYDGSAKRSVFPSIAKDIGMNFAEADRIVDTIPSADAIDKNLLHLEALALQNGSALGVGFAFPVTVDQFRQWSETMNSDSYELVPASVLVGLKVTPDKDGNHNAGH